MLAQFQPVVLEPQPQMEARPHGRCRSFPSRPGGGLSRPASPSACSKTSTAPVRRGPQPAARRVGRRPRPGLREQRRLRRRPGAAELRRSRWRRGRRGWPRTSDIAGAHGRNAGDPPQASAVRLRHVERRSAPSAATGRHPARRGKTGCRPRRAPGDVGPEDAGDVGGEIAGARVEVHDRHWEASRRSARRPRPEIGHGAWSRRRCRSCSAAVSCSWLCGAERSRMKSPAMSPKAAGTTTAPRSNQQRVSPAAQALRGGR